MKTRNVVTAALALLFSVGFAASAGPIPGAALYRPMGGHSDGSARVRRRARKARNQARNRAAHR